MSKESMKLALDAVYETIIQWDEGGVGRSRRELARRIVALAEQPAQPQEPMTYRCAVMGEGKVAIGGCKRSTDGLPGIIYLDMAGEQREINADTTDLFPVGSAIEPSRVLAAVHFLTAESVQQSIDVLREILEGDFGATSPPAQRKPLTDDPLQGAVDWLLEADGEYFCTATVQRTLRIGYNRAKRLCDTAKLKEKNNGN